MSLYKILILAFLCAIFLCCSLDNDPQKILDKNVNTQINSDSMLVLNKNSILDSLDNSIKSPYSDFINFDAVYCEYANGRLTLFRSHDKWALVFEKLGFDFRSGDTVLFEIYYFGNCIENLEIENGFVSNYKFFGVENNIFTMLESNKDSINFNGYQIKIPLNKKAYTDMKIPLEYGTNKIYEGAVLRYLAEKNKELTYATDNLIYTCLPKELKKIMVVDDWYHENYQHSDLKLKPSKQIFYNNIAEVLSTGDVKKFIKPKKVNTHWINWLDSGTY